MFIVEFIEMLFVDSFDTSAKKQLEVLEEEIKSEVYLIGASRYYISSSKYIAIGISLAAGCIPILKIVTPAARIYFTSEEFYEFCKDNGCTYNHVIEYYTYGNISLINLKSRRSQILLSLETFQNFFNLMELIKERLKMLSDMDFLSVYNSALNFCLELKGSNVCEVTKLFTFAQEKSFVRYCLIEALHLCTEKFFGDLKNRQLYNK